MADLQSFLDAFLARVWVEDDMSDLASGMHRDVVLEGLEESPLTGLADFLRFQRMVQAQFRVKSYRTLVAVENGDWVSAVGEFTATERQTGKTGRARIHMMMRLQDGRIIESYNIVDYLSFFEQLGRLPARTLDRCLLEQALQPVPHRA